MRRAAILLSAASGAGRPAQQKPKLKGHLKLALSVGFAAVPVMTLMAINRQPEVLKTYREFKEKSVNTLVAMGNMANSAVESAEARHQAKEAAAKAKTASIKAQVEPRPVARDAAADGTTARDSAASGSTPAGSYTRSKAQSI